MKGNPKPRYWHSYITEDMVVRARTGEMIEYLIAAVIDAAADFDMFASGKVDPAENDHESSYWYFRDIINRLGIPPEIIVEAIDDCCPDRPGKNLTDPTPLEPSLQPPG